MELIQIDVAKVFIGKIYVSQYDELPKTVLLDAETGVVYFNGKYPRYDSNGRIMVIPQEQLPGIIARAKAQVAAEVAAERAEQQKKYGSIQV